MRRSRSCGAARTSDLRRRWRIIARNTKTTCAWAICGWRRRSTARARPGSPAGRPRSNRRRRACATSCAKTCGIPAWRRRASRWRRSPRSDRKRISTPRATSCDWRGRPIPRPRWRNAATSSPFISPGGRAAQTARWRWPIDSCKHYPNSPFADSVQFVRAEELLERGALEESGTGFERLAEERPDSPLVPGALFGAGHAALRQQSGAALERSSTLFESAAGITNDADVARGGGARRRPRAPAARPAGRGAAAERRPAGRPGRIRRNCPGRRHAHARRSVAAAFHR